MPRLHRGRNHRFPELRTARDDVTALVALPGVGKKTAERMVVDLRDKVQALAEELEIAPAAIGELCDREGIKVRHCQLNCF